MNKQDAVILLKALQAEVEKLKAIIEKPDEPHVFQGRYLREGLGDKHWWLVANGEYRCDRDPSDESSKFGLCFATEEDVKQHRKHLRLMQEARVAMAKSWGDEEVDWTNGSQRKYVIGMSGEKPIKDSYSYSYCPIHFRAEDDRDEFFSAYSEGELKLMIMGVQ